jgi:alanine racemase
VPVLAEHRILPVIVSEEHGQLLAGAAQQSGCRLNAHLKIDTGMGRFGLAWSEAVAAYERLALLPGLRVSGICTHFASVEPRKAALGLEQMERFQAIAAELIRQSREPLFRHASSSRAFQYYRDWDLDGVRPGIVAYGYGANERGMRARTRPILEWRTAVMQVKRVPAGFPIGYYSTHATTAPTVIATVACGYADGYHRSLSNRGFALVRGRRSAVVGRVSMNWITLDCGPDSEVAVGDEVVLIGRQGQESVWANDLARLGRTIAYETLTSIHASIPRRYRGASLPVRPPLGGG